MTNLDDRFWFWAGSVTAVIAAWALFGPTAVVVLFAFVSLQALREFLTLTHTRRGDHWALLAAFFVVLPFQYVLIGIDWYGMSAIMIPVYAFLGLPIISVLRGDTKRFMERIAEVQWGLMTCVYCISYVPALLMLDISGFEGRGLLLIMFLGLVVQGAALAHEALQRHLSSSAMKSSVAREALQTATAGALIGALLCGITPFNVLQAAGLGIVIALLGLAGSLVMDAVKRDRGVEHWRRAEQTERDKAGLLDRLERIVFAAPVFFHLVRFWWVA